MTDDFDSVKSRQSLRLVGWQLGEAKPDRVPPALHQIRLVKFRSGQVSSRLPVASILDCVNISQNVFAAFLIHDSCYLIVTLELNLPLIQGHLLH